MTELRKVERVERFTPALEVTRQLLDYLLQSGNIGVGDRLPSERELCETFEVGRSAVREALKLLSVLGLLEIRQGDGTYLRSATSTLLPQVIQWGMLLGDKNAAELMDARRVIEGGLAELAAQRRTEEDLAALRERLEALRLSRTVSEWVDSDVEFHLQIARSAHSGTLADVLFRLRSLLDSSVRHNRQQADHEASNDVKYREHERILLAIEDRDPAAAAYAMRTHIDRVRERLAAGGAIENEAATTS
ncbi:MULTISPECIES: FadR/GntR family transcriptional regulator [unclassified Amycolatopsis]|uniref:FadR/GntR family transcriptional regulator n=1 Tax=unclassified Amycolatopsis TaxID=2618356 RepID=UPI001C6A2F5D|nr:FadR/GntR family transcriptional regulator [Amycolatopsis sp. DSM 110486]QYN19139.1 FadR family transcriptional regulator [Amycolatopsis sp. DSM 110486]